MSDLDHKEFEEYMSGEHELSRLYSQIEKLTPSAEMDMKILAGAQTALKKTAAFRIVKRRWWMAGLDSPMALAAIVMLCASLVLLYSNQQEMTIDSDIPQRVVQEGESDLSDKSEKRTETLIQERKAPSLSIKKEINVPESAELTEPALSPPAVSGDLQQQTQDNEPDAISKILPSSGRAFKREESKQLNERSLEAMITDIKRLITEGQTEEARLAFRQFILIYPDAQITDWFSEQELSVIKN